MKILHLFSKEQLEWLNKEKMNISDQDYTDDEIVDMIEKLEDLLLEKGIENNDENAYGNMCGDILTIFGLNT